MKRYPECILATAVLPWDRRERLMEDLFREQIRLLRERLTPHLYLFGTAGEGYAVSDRLFDRIVRVFLEEMPPPQMQPMVGIIHLSLATMLERIERCVGWGVRDFMIALPSWGGLADDEVDCFFQSVCGRFRECRFLHYNLPRSQRLLRGDDYARLAEAHPNLVAVKYGGGPDRAGRLELLIKAPQLQYFFSEFGYAEVRDRHECGLLSSLVNIHPEMARQFFQARGPQLAELCRQVEAIGEAVRESGNGRTYIDGAYDKMLIKTLLPEFPLRLLSPYSGMSGEQFQTFLAKLPPEWRHLEP
ncbi:beta/alpha barrel domain-containing protein [Candidatus Laterigemmans baculatus]|uniref:hypothetical protein n=1 Tax=Candidatus Laterigemmans baculatus TaxID=2770505 RepID=UPI0013DCEB3F|nr:hypothetical protein [Candidatus Laterigemmans baculatus]